VEPIHPKDFKDSHSQATMSKGYKVAFLTELKGEILQHSTPVMLQQNSPACSYWYIYQTQNGIVKICLY